MQHYRCYFLDDARHITAVETRACTDDTDAIQWAESIFRKHPRCQAIEVWCRARMMHERNLANGEAPADGQEARRPASAPTRAADKT